MPEICTSANALDSRRHPAHSQIKPLPASIAHPMCSLSINPRSTQMVEPGCRRPRYRKRPLTGGRTSSNRFTKPIPCSARSVAGRCGSSPSLTRPWSSGRSSPTLSSGPHIGTALRNRSQHRRRTRPRERCRACGVRPCGPSPAPWPVSVPRHRSSEQFRLDIAPPLAGCCSQFRRSRGLRPDREAARPRSKFLSPEVLRIKSGLHEAVGVEFWGAARNPR